MAKWILRNKQFDYVSLGQNYNIDPLIAKILVNRGIITDSQFKEYLYCSSSIQHSPLLMKNMKKGVELLYEKLCCNKYIRIIGDYDVDGVTSATILKKGLDFVKSVINSNSDIDVIIPHRIYDGYGLNTRMIDNAINDGVDTILTCDNGISARDEIEKAVAGGITVIVTDHHEIPFKEEDGIKQFILPAANVIIDPHQADCEYPYKEICGAVVAYKLIQALISYVDEMGAGVNGYEMLLSELTELAGLASVADIMELKNENRYFVSEALSLISNSKNTGLRCLATASGLTGKKLCAHDLGFIIGPCINAAGRLDSAERALKLLLCEDETKATSMALDIIQLNEKRKNIQEKAVQDAIDIIESTGYDSDKVLVVYIPDCHESIAGIVAGKIKEKYSKPTFIITDSENGAKGSARSIEAYNIYEEMTKVSHLFTKFGGHSQAAGFSLEYENIDRLREELNEKCTLTDEEMMSVLYIDAAAPFSYFNEAIMNSFDLLEPTGNGNEKCLFARKNLVLCGSKIYEKVSRFKVEDSDGFVTELVMFRRSQELIDILNDKYGEDAVKAALNGRGNGLVRFSVAYYPKWNEYNGRRNIQFVVQDFCI